MGAELGSYLKKMYLKQPILSFQLRGCSVNINTFLNSILWAIIDLKARADRQFHLNRSLKTSLSKIKM